MEKSCKTCESNFDGVCAGHGNVYEYGETIVDDSKLCDDWSASFEYFTYQTNHAPRFLRDAYNRCCISYQEFSRKFDDFKDGKAVPINFFDAIKAVYGLSMVDIAVLLDVTFGVVYRAKTQGFSSKRIKQFSNALRVPENLLLNTTTGDFEELEQCKRISFNPMIRNYIFRLCQNGKCGWQMTSVRLFCIVPFILQNNYPALTTCSGRTEWHWMHTRKMKLHLFIICKKLRANTHLLFVWSIFWILEPDRICP